MAIVPAEVSGKMEDETCPFTDISISLLTILVRLTERPAYSKLIGKYVNMF